MKKKMFGFLFAALFSLFAVFPIFSVLETKAEPVENTRYINFIDHWCDIKGDNCLEEVVINGGSN